ncbi:hypothetical protein MMC18_009075 [Xylographa bjoerkii]|nr:hypothetical protein [Xylographa bjoerkii]
MSSKLAFLATIAFNFPFPALCYPWAYGYHNSNVICQNYTIPMTVSSEIYIYNSTISKDNFELTDFVSASSSVNSTNIFLPVEKDPVVQEFQLEVHGTFCHPAHIAAEQESTVIIATHGIEGDGSYWNSPYKPDKYNFVDAAAKQGYSVFYYDRIGTGNSTKLSGYVNQLSLQVEVLSNLIKEVKAGTYTDSLSVPSKVVVLGFSFGSFVTTTLVATEPTLMDGAILTGLGYAPTAFAPFFEAYQSRIAATQHPAKFGVLDSGVLTWVDVFANINTYFKQPNYEIDVAEYSEIIKQPYSVGEVLSLQLGLGVTADAGNFTGPVLALTGEYDFFACAGYCPGFLEDNLTPLYSGAKALQIAIHPNSGHSINYKKNATGAFNVITNSLHTNGF